MPYGSIDELPASVRQKIKSKVRRRQWMHVWNGEYAKHGDEARAFGSAWAATERSGGVQKVKQNLKVSKESANYKAQTIDNEHCSVCTMFEAPDSCTLVRGTIRPGGWCKFFRRKHADVSSKAAPGALAKVEADSQKNRSLAVHRANHSTEAMMPNQDNAIRFFMPIAKIDKERQTVSGYASTETKDLDGEVISLDAIKKALPGYMAWRNIREMHRLSAVGTAQEANVDGNGLFLTARIVDPKAWKKCLEGVYKGFSVGGRKLNKVGDTITEIDLQEISVVDRPANPDCRFSVAKSAKARGDDSEGYLLKVSSAETGSAASAKALRKLAKTVVLLTKQQADPDADDAGAENQAEGEATHKAPSREPYGDVEYADPGYQADGKKRYPIDTEDHVRAALSYIGQERNAGKYSPEHLSAIKGRIHVAAKKHGIDVDESKKAKKKEAKKALRAGRRLRVRKAIVDSISLAPAKPPFLTLGAGVQAGSSLATVPAKVKKADRGGSSFLELGDEPAKSKRKLASANGQESESVVGEWLVNLLSGETTMSNGNESTNASDLGQVILNMVKRAAEPTRAQRLQAAQKNMRKARMARKECATSIRSAHEVLKAAYMAKAARAKDKDKPAVEDDEPMEKAMMELNKAFGAIAKVATYSKAARIQLKKAASRVGQKGEEVGDGNQFYQVPRGVKDLRQSDLTDATPGGPGSASQPPMYPVDGKEYPGKAAGGAVDLRKFADKDGRVSADVVAMAVENATLRGTVDGLSRLPVAGTPRRGLPYNFDMTKIVGNQGQVDPVAKAVYDSGIRPADLVSEDESTRNLASATVAGQYVLDNGKSIFDPAFRGAAGNGRRAN